MPLGREARNSPLVAHTMKLIVAENNPEDAQFITAAFGSREDARILQGASVLTAARDPADAGWEIALAQSASECLDLLATEAADLLLLAATPLSCSSRSSRRIPSCRSS